MTGDQVFDDLGMLRGDIGGFALIRLEVEQLPMCRGLLEVGR